MTEAPVRRGAAAPPSRLARLAAPAGVALLGLAGAGYVAAVDPNQAGHYPTCPFLLVTGLFCPGCGSLRAIHALTHGDVAAALSYNPATVLAVPLVAVLWVLWVRRQAAGRPRSWAAPGWAIWTLLGAIVAFWVLRNLPWFAWLAP